MREGIKAPFVIDFTRLKRARSVLLSQNTQDVMWPLVRPSLQHTKCNLFRRVLEVASSVRNCDSSAARSVAFTSSVPSHVSVLKNNHNLSKTKQEKQSGLVARTLIVVFPRVPGFW